MAGPAGRGGARHGLGRHGKARQGLESQGRQGGAGFDAKRHETARQAWRVMARRNSVCQGRQG